MRIVSGMRPTGKLHIGHLLGALRNWKALQDDGKNECFFFVADWHALTTNYEHSVNLGWDLTPARRVPATMPTTLDGKVLCVGLLLTSLRSCPDPRCVLTRRLHTPKNGRMQDRLPIGGRRQPGNAEAVRRQLAGLPLDKVNV